MFIADTTVWTWRVPYRQASACARLLREAGWPASVKSLQGRYFVNIAGELSGGDSSGRSEVYWLLAQGCGWAYDLRDRLAGDDDR